MLVNGFHYPKSERETANAIEREWKAKSDYIFKLTGGRGTVVQAGANCGYFPVKLSEQYEQVITYEPIPEIYKLAHKNIVKHGATNVKLYQMGLASEAITAIIDNFEENNLGATSIVENDEGIIECMSIDNLFLDDVSLIWLDIEGMEAEALRGAVNTIQRCKPVIVVENKGLIPEARFGGGVYNKLGSSEFRRWIQWGLTDVNYIHDKRIMRDDIFVPVKR